MTMFKTAAAKIAHSSTVPALAVNQELRPLQDLITAEKAVLISLQKLSVDFSKASEALRTWGLSEGDDLGDILGASTTVLNHFSAALSQYAAHGHPMREHLKSIRTREENLEEMKRRRRTIFRKADDADKKLSKMNPEHKNLQMQLDILNRLREEIRTLDTDIMVEEAALGDFKRTATRMFIGLKFGGLMECCQKGSIAATFGKMIGSEISEEQTQPGLHRAFYQGHANTESLVAEAHRAVNEVTLSTMSTVGFRDRRQYYNGGETSIPPGPDNKPIPTVPGDSSEYLDYPILQRPFANDVPSSPRSTSQKQDWFSNTEQPIVSRERLSVDDFGMNARSNVGPTFDNKDASGRFATFPAKGRTPVIVTSAGYATDPLPLQVRHDLGPSFASSVAEAFDHKENPFSEGKSAVSGRSGLPPLPPNAIPPSNPWADATDDIGTKNKLRLSNFSDNDDPLLAYMVSAEEEVGISSRPSDLEVRRVRDMQLGNVPEAEHNFVSLEKESQSSRPPSRVNSLTISYTPQFAPADPRLSEDKPARLSAGEQERALNAAAAREISLELEALNTSRPPMDAFERGRTSPGSALSLGEPSWDSSPLAPPSAPFARRSISPHPYPEMNFATSSSANQEPPYAPAYGPLLSSSVPAPENQFPPRSVQGHPPSRLQMGSSPLSASPITTPGAPGTPRTISAAAFKRPRNTSIDNAVPGPRGISGSPHPAGSTRPVSVVPGTNYVPPSEQLEHRLSQVESEYDYIDAYMQPNSEEFGSASTRPGEAGYGTGKFSTELEGST